MRSLGEVRRQLAADYRGRQAPRGRTETGDRRPSAQELRRQHERLAAEKQRFEQWLSGREQEVEQRAARLVAREQQLDAQEAGFRDRGEQWELDRLAYQREIERFRGELAEAGVPA